MMLLVGKGLGYGVGHLFHKVRTRCLALPGVSLFEWVFLVNFFSQSSERTLKLYPSRIALPVGRC